MTKQDAARDAAYISWMDANPKDWESRQEVWRAAYTAGVAHGRAEAWREIEIIAGDSLPRDWGRIAREVREVRETERHVK